MTDLPEPQPDPLPERVEPPASEQPERRRLRLPRTTEGTLASALLVSAGINGVFGLLVLIFPRFVWNVVGGAADTFDPAYAATRFAGAVLIALAVGALLVLGRPEGQNTLVTVLALEKTLVTAALIVNLAVDDTPLRAWFEVLAAVGSAGLAAYLWWARIRGRKLLRA